MMLITLTNESRDCRRNYDKPAGGNKSNTFLLRYAMLQRLSGKLYAVALSVRSPVCLSQSRCSIKTAKHVVTRTHDGPARL